MGNFVKTLIIFVPIALVLSGCASGVSRPVRDSLHESARTDAERAVADGWAEDFSRTLRSSGFRSGGGSPASGRR